MGSGCTLPMRNRHIKPRRDPIQRRTDAANVDMVTKKLTADVVTNYVFKIPFKCVHELN